METLNDIVTALIEHIGKKASEITNEDKRAGLHEHDIKLAIDQTCDEDLYNHVISEGFFALAAFEKVDGEKKEKAKQAKHSKM